MKKFAFRLHRRIGLMIVAVVVATSTIFGLVGIGLAYSVEDQQFEEALENEVVRQQRHWQATGILPEPQLDYVRIYRQRSDLPADLRYQLELGSEQSEFAGEQGRHYHLVRFHIGEGQARRQIFAAAEVSRYLIMRPNLGFVLTFLAVLTAMIAAAMGLVGFLLAKRSLKPLSLLASEVTVSDNAVPTIDPAIYPANEIGLLAARLSQAFERIRQFVAREQSFTRDASHELRTPIAVISGAAELIALQPNLPLSSRDALRRIDTATQDMAEALDLLLALARERDVQEWEPTMLRPLVEKAIADTVSRFPDHGLGIEVGIDPSMEVLVRPRLLQLILNNLIANSFQHSKASLLTLRGEANSLVIADNGQGLWGHSDPFETYAKGADSSGSGLGLDIVRRLCAVDDIDLQCRQSNKDFGVEFVLHFNRHYELMDMGHFVYKAI